jgi:AAA ATPase domain
MSSSQRVTRFGLKNFKAFHYLEDIELKPLTVLVGANSSGKSSIFQALLLLKQTSVAPGATTGLKFSGEWTKLGSFANVVSDFDAVRTIEYRIGIEFMVSGGTPRSRYFPHIKLAPEASPRVTGDITFLFGASGEPPQTTLRRTTVAARPSELPPGDQDVFLQYADTEPHLVHKNIHNVRGHKVNPPDVSFVGFWLNSLIMEGGVSNRVIAIDASILSLRSLIERIEYLGPMRADPLPFYPVEEEPSIGLRGEGTIPYLLRRQHDPVRYAPSPVDKIHEAPLLDAVNHWLHRMKVTSRLTIDPVESIAFTAAIQSMSATSKSVNLAQVGFGISQLLPVLVMGLKGPSDAWLLFEQPEIHLHPRLQGELGDFFLATARSGKNLMVETHSDHLVNRLRRRIAEDETGELAKMVQILFVHAGTPDNPSSYVEPLAIDEMGTIINCPPDFFSETADEAFAILDSRRKRAKKGG